MIGFYDGDLKAVVTVLIMIGIAIGAGLMWLVPIGWSWIKPFIHQLTA